MRYIFNFNETGEKDTAIAGGKGVSLGEMVRAGLPVPPGFVVLATAYEKFLKEKKIPEDVAEEIKKAFKKLGAKHVAVRSSATAEDSKNAAWAGQLESYLNTTEKDLLKNVRGCWESLSSPRAKFYRAEQGLTKKKISVAVVVQKMIESEISGVAFSVHPVTENRNQMIIEAVFGLGNKLVSGKVTPDSYVIEKKGFKLVDVKKEGKQKLSEKQVKELAKLIIKIEKHFGFPVDVEWAFSKGKFYIVQSRPITTLENLKYKKQKTKNKKVLLKGISANHGTAIGMVRIIHDDVMNDKLLIGKLSKIKKGEILVTEMTRPLFVNCMRTVSAIITDEGGILCHAAMVSREFDLPCIVNARNATKVLQNGQKISVDANKGIIYEA